MISVTVKRRYLATAPRKVRFILDSIRNKNALAALDQLTFLNKGSAIDVVKLLKSGIAAAKQKNAIEEKLVVKEARADEGPSQKRRFILGKGQSTIFKKTSSHVVITLTEVDQKIKPIKAKKVKTKLKNTVKGEE